MFKPLLACNADLSKILYPVYSSPKLDGIRCLCINGVAMSRSMKPIPNRYIQEEFAKYADILEGLDGELTVGEPTAKNCYNASVSGVMSQDGKPDFTYHVFDRIGDSSYTERWLYTHDALARDIPFVEFVVQNKLLDEEELSEAEQMAVGEGYEGLMLRDPYGRYKQGRSTISEGLLLKVKRFDDCELEVVDMIERLHNGNEATTNELGRTQRSSHQANMVGRGDLGALVCRYGDTTVNVGSGFTDEQRSHLWTNKSQYIGKLAKIKHQSSGAKDKLRFPIFIGFRDPDDIS